MALDLSLAEQERLLRLSYRVHDDPSSDVGFLAGLLWRLISAMERREDYEREQAEQRE